jgi:hypothetical protein
MSIYDEGNSIFNDEALYNDVGIHRETHPQRVTGTKESQVRPDFSASVAVLLLTIADQTLECVSSDAERSRLCRPALTSARR